MAFKNRRIFKNKDKLLEFVCTKPDYLQPLYNKIISDIPEYKEGVWFLTEEKNIPSDTNPNKEPPYLVGGYLNINICFEPFELG